MAKSLVMGATGTIPAATPRVRHDGADPPPGDGRVVRPRRALPNGRAVAGGLLLALAALGIFTAWQATADGPSTTYAVATRDLAPGETIGPSDAVMRTAELPSTLAAAAFRDPATLDGAVALGPIGAGELLERSEVSERGGRTPAHELSFPVPADRALGGRLRVGERVAVLATFGTGQDSSTKVVAGDALVLAVDESRSGVEGDAVVLTLAVESADEVVALAHAARAGEVTIARAAGAAEPLPADG